ncbi:chemotaxis protein CheD [Coprothermobacter platensis]|uniref:chemotaxis protein CheD n=1 Tax=Coprothermobacter platensis TaxID=108819 RepID=UPI00035D4B81|nr:chemotaxis protein CheD [Coprothermobacter platensis]
MSDMVNVGIGEVAVLTNPGRIAAIGLGSCVAVAVFDPVAKVGGMVHVLLPDSRGQKTDLPGKFADTGVPYLFKLLEEKGVRKERVIVKIAGGASLMNVNVGGFGDIGKRNIEAVKSQLERLGVRIQGEDVGGNEGRTLILDLAQGTFNVKTSRGAFRQF